MYRLACVLLAACLSACHPTPGADTQLEGELQGPVDLPKGSQATVVLEAVGPADRAAQPVAETLFAARDDALHFSLRYQPESLPNGHQYALRARIVDASGQLLWVTDTRHPLPVPVGQPLQLHLVAVQPPAEAQVYFYQCGDQALAVSFDGNQARLRIEDQEIQLTRTPAASGSRYQSELADLWLKGDEAMLSLAGQARLACQKQTSARPYADAV